MTYTEACKAWANGHQGEHGLWALSLDSGTILNILPSSVKTPLSFILGWIGLSNYTGVVFIRLISFFTPQGFYANGDSEVTVDANGRLKVKKWIGPVKTRTDITQYILAACQEDEDETLPEAA